MKNLLLLSVFLLFVACESPDSEMSGDIMEAEYESFMEIPATRQPAPPEELENDQVTKKVVKTGGVNFKSENVAADYQKIQALLPKFNAYIENENQSKSTQRIDYNLTIRVPSDRYDTLYSSISNMAFRLDNRYSNMEDVTVQYYDLKTRITNKKALEERYRALLLKASAIKDILEIERNLNEIRTEIEQLQGQFNYLSKQVDFSTINLSFYEELPYVYDSSPRKGFGARIFSALDSGWQGFLSFLIGLTSLWPFAILAVGGIYLFRKLRRKWKK